MTIKTWETVKTQYCQRAGREVALEAETIYPADILPDQPPRLGAHRCSQGAACSALDRPACQWAGSTPGYDPFAGPA